jgi:hypothetical protein
MAFHAALCSFTCRIVSSVSFFDHRIGSKAGQAMASVPTEAVVVAKPIKNHQLSWWFDGEPLKAV